MRLLSRPGRFGVVFGLFLTCLAVKGGQPTYTTPYTITTLAGSANAGGGYGDGTGSAARFNEPVGVAVDGSGNVYVADMHNGMVRKVTPAGVVTTFAQNLGNPGGIAIDGSGTLYVTDHTSGALYKISPAGAVSTFVAGGAFGSPYGVAVDSNGNVYVADTGNYVIRKVNSSGLVTTYAGSVGNSGFMMGAANTAQFNYPTGVAVNSSGDVFVVDTGANAICRISGGAVSTYAGNPPAPVFSDGGLPGGLDNPTGIAIDASNNIYLTDTHQMVRMIAGGTISSLAGSYFQAGSNDGTGATAFFSFNPPTPAGIAVDSSGNIYVADTSNNEIRLGRPPGASPVAPSITVQPTNQTVSTGGNATFSVTASGTAPLTYQWTFNGGNISGATGSSYTVTSAQPSNAGSYQVTVTNGQGSVISASATLTVNAVAPQITSQPANQNPAIGAPASFLVTATGTAPLSYQWTFNGSPISGATSASYSIASVQASNAGTYAVIVSNSAGTATSAGATLTINTPAPQITSQPQSQAAVAGSPVSFAVAATGAGTLTYQWSFNGTAIPGATAATYGISSVQASNAGTYQVAVTNPGGTTTSAQATLTVNLPPSISTQPQSQTVAAGSSVTFSVVASGTGTLSYQWLFNGVQINGATAATYALTNVQAANAGSYEVTVTNAFGSVSSSVATLGLASGLAIIAQPQSQTVSAGANSTLSVTASGNGLAYQWYLNGTAIAGATGATLSFANIGTTQGGSYTVVVTDGSGHSVTSSAANLSVSYNSRLANLSILSGIEGSLSMGFVIGGAGTSGSEPLLIRAVGPSIGPGTVFNVPGILPDPSLTVVGQTSHATVASNAGWGTPASNIPAVQAADASTGAFALTNTGSLDSAVVATLPEVSGGYSAVVAGKTGDSGSALTEVYDDTPESSYVQGSSPRLVNLSCLTQIAAGGTLDVGFVVEGTTAETLLIRATGPSIGPGTVFNVSGAMPDPKITVEKLDQSATFATNAGWAGSAQITAADSLTGAFPLSNPSSLDSAVVVTLQPNTAYAVAVSSASGAAGAVLVEIYEVP